METEKKQETGNLEEQNQLLKETLQELFDPELLQVIFSAPKNSDAAVRIKVRPLQLKEQLVFQAAFWDGKKEIHKNYEKQNIISAALVWLERDYRQMQAETTRNNISALVSKKGKITIKKKKNAVVKEAASLSHNRKKHYILEEGIPVPFLVELGVMTPEGNVVKSRYDKFRQINRFLEFIEDITPELPRGRELTMIDFGCGKSYLTFAMYYYLRERKGFDLRIIGLDLKKDVIEHCNALARQFHYEKLEFLTGDIADYEGVSQVDLVVTLHACDTATDYALAKAVEWNARAILSVPCCQHELNGQIHNDILQPVLKYGLLKERMAALITDGLRASRLEEAGYQVQVLEFIDMEHTPKNILIRAVRGTKKITPGMGKKNPEAEMNNTDQGKALEACMEFLQVKPLLNELLNQR